ncbi:MAG: DsbA family protein [Deltaproteobacteria bacterium]|nr:DsbA family protein [Deltaproteobacteria bacterium]
MDQYLSIRGSYMFVRRAPESAQPDKVLMTVFEDFHCPACYNATTQVFPSLKEKYGNRLEVHFLGVPLAHPDSRLAARAYVIAHELGFGEAMQNALFRAHFEEEIDTASKEGLAKVADSIGLAPELLLNQLESNGGAAEVEQNITQADSYQVDSTPTLILDGWIKINDVSPTNVTQIIDGLLEKKKLVGNTTVSSQNKPSSKGRKASP